MPRTVRAAVWGYCSRVIDRGNGRAVVFRIGSLDERMAALLSLDTSLRSIGHPQKLVET